MNIYNIYNINNNELNSLDKTINKTKTKTMRILKTKNVKTPTRGTAQSAGIDFYVPNDYAYTVLKPNEDILIPSGIKARIPQGYALVAYNKSGVATKKKLLTGACVVDEDYTGEIHIHLFNAGRKDVTIEPGEKIVQFILQPVFYDIVEEVKSERTLWEGMITERGTGGFGSTNKPKPDFVNEHRIENEVDLDTADFETIMMHQEVVKQTPKISNPSTMFSTTGKTAVLISKGTVNESIRTKGTYQRHTFRDFTTNELYLLDVSYICPHFYNLEIGDTLTGLDVFTNPKTKKQHVNGKSKFLNLGNIEVIKEEMELSKPKRKTISLL